MRKQIGVRRLVGVLIGIVCVGLAPARSAAQSAEGDPVTRIDLPVGRSYPITTSTAISRVSIANPDVADLVVIGERELVVNSKAGGETDAIIWQANGTRLHYRVSVHSPADRQQIALYVKFAEVRKDALLNFNVGAQYSDANTVARAGNLSGALYVGVLSNFGTDRFRAFLEAAQQKGDARILAEPNLMAGNKDTANFLAGGELPIPIAQGGDVGGGVRVTILFREFGVRLRFSGEIISDSLIRLYVRPEVSDLDFANAVTISGFRVPAIRTRRVESTLDVKRNQSLIISGMFNHTQERVKTGIPLLMDLPIIGPLFASNRFQTFDSELLVVVTPVIVDPMHPRAQDRIQLLPDTTLPAREAIEKRLPHPPGSDAPDAGRP